MGKFLGAVLILVLAYFAFLKRTEPPKEVPAPEEQAEQFEIIPPSSVSSAPQAVSSAASISATTALNATDSVFGEEGSLSDDADESGELAKDEPKENVDQTIIGNERRLAEAKSAQEVFELLRKLRIRPRKLGDISTAATAKDYSKFWGSYEGSALNNRNEVIYGLKIDLVAPADGAKSNVIGNYQLNKAGQAPSKHEFSSANGVQLVGRDALVIETPQGQSYFQFYKLDNGYLAGNYYEKISRRTRTYRFVLKNK